MNRSKSFFIIAVIYTLAAAFGITIYRLLPYSYWLNLLLADTGATILVFIFSAVFRNASVYDPYWSVFPPVAITLFAFGRDLTGLNLLQLGAIWLWGIRLTGNWAYTFHGLHAQDWRYTKYQNKTGKWYPVVNFFGIHYFPTLIVYFCTLPAFYALQNGLSGGPLSYAFVFVSVFAAVLQATADHQMHTFRKTHSGELLQNGLWTYSRHPNYLGEILMWWGIALSVLCVAPRQLWLLSGAIINTFLFLFISIPMAEERQSRKPGYEEYKAETRMLLPIKPRRRDL